MEKTERKNDGVLDSTFLVDGPEHEPDDHEEGQGDQQQATPEAEPQKTPLTRRQKARERDERILSEIKADREAREQRDAEYREHLESIRRENAELRGQLNGMASRPAEQQRRDDTPDPDKLEAEAIAALDRKDFATYQRKMREAAKADVMRDLAPRLQQQTPQPAPQIHPALNYLAGQYGDVTANPEAFAVAQAHDQALARQNIPEGPERWKRAFERGRQVLALGNGKQAPQFSQRNRDVVAGVPTGGSGNGAGAGSGGGKGVILTAEERVASKKFKMTEAAYAQHLAAMHPERIVE
jgi:hypothetical protein